jgi:hypothetical protein
MILFRKSVFHSGYFPGFFLVVVVVVAATIIVVGVAAAAALYFLKNLFAVLLYIFFLGVD